MVTAGNASGIVDGAAALVIVSRRYATATGCKPIGRLLSWGVVGVDPSIMGIGPAPAIRAALVRAGLVLDDIDLFEINEAFAPQVIGCCRELGIDWREKVNVHGGAIALGHPLAASGARITAHLIYALQQRGGGLALGSACIGGGQGIAVIVRV